MVNHVVYENVGASKNALVIHGMASESAAWHNTIKHLQYKNYNTITLDLSGHGFSERKSSYSFTGWVDEILDNVEGRNITPHVVVGHSLGGLLSASVSNRLKNVEKMLLVDPLLHVPSNIMQYVVKKVISRFESADESSLRKSHPTWHNHMIIDELVTLSRWDSNTLEALKSEEGWDIASDFLSSPHRGDTLIIKPKHSFLLPTKYVDSLEKTYGINVMEIPNTGHSIHRDNPKNYSQILDVFLDNGYRGGCD
jgi:pimeloyl-ACP methyl ester carboxylesterase